MNPFKKLLKKLEALTFPQEFLCLDPASFDQPLHAYLMNDKQVIKDITKLHSFVGYSPLIFAINKFRQTDLPEEIKVVFSQNSVSPNDSIKNKDALATLNLKKIKEQTAGNAAIFYYEGSRGNHQFISSFQQWIMQFNNRLFNDKPGNVFLAGNLFRQVQIAYSIPRNISLITVGRDGLFNLFPTDLHGAINEDYYIISLREGGKACRQVLESRQISLSRMETSFYKTVYALGKNHMQDMKGIENFPFSPRLSENFQLPIPLFSLSYSELELVELFRQGIHCIMLFRTIYRQDQNGNDSSLTHIHNLYASWRENRGLPGNYLLR